MELNAGQEVVTDLELRNNHRESSIGMGAGYPCRVLARTWSGWVQWNLVHSQRPAIAMDGQECHLHFREAVVLLLHAGLGGLLHRQQTTPGRHAVVLQGRISRIHCDEGVKAVCVDGAESLKTSQMA
jgi:hypothetical protein